MSSQFFRALVTAAFCSTAVAGPWTLGPGHHYTKLTYAFSTTDSRFASSGERRPLSDAAFLGEGFGALVNAGRLRAHTIGLHAEVGVLPSLDVLAKLGWVSSSTRFFCGSEATPQRCQADAIGKDSTSVTMDHRGFGDLELGAKWEVLSQPSIALLASAAFPTYSNDRKVLRTEDQNLFNDRTALGTGAIAIEGRLLVGRAFDRAFIAIETGYRARSADYTDQLVYLGQVGARIWNRLSGAIMLDGFVSLGVGSRKDAAEPPLAEETVGPLKVLHANREDAHRVRLSLTVEILRGLELDVGTQWAYAGIRTNASWGLDAGLSLRR